MPIFNNTDCKRIANVVKRVEKMPNGLAAGRSLNGSTIPRIMLPGKLDGTLSRDGSATMSVWRFNGTSEVETSEDVTVYGWFLKTGQTITAGKRVAAELDLTSGRYYCTCAECP